MSLFRHHRTLLPLEERGPLRAMFLINDMSVGGAEMLLFNLIQRVDRTRVEPELCCMGALGQLGEQLADNVPVFSNLLRHKYDWRVIGRLTRLLLDRRIDAVVTVGAGDRMFWGRIAAWRAGVPVIASALHSTGWPDVIGRLNHLLTPLTDAFIGCARPHADYLIDQERLPADRVHVINNGVDTERYVPRPANAALCASIGVAAAAPLIGIVAVLRPEKNHELFLAAAKLVVAQRPDAQFVIIGDGPRRDLLEKLADELDLTDAVHFLGARKDVPELLTQLNVFALTSKVEANPVSILEAQSCGVPVVATRVGSIPATVLDGVTGYLAEPENAQSVADGILRLIDHPASAAALGQSARQNVVQHWSLAAMVRGYEELLTELYRAKARMGKLERGMGNAESLSVVSNTRD